VEVNGSYKHSSLSQYGINYGHQFFMIQLKLGAYPEFYSDRFLALPTNIRFGWMRLTVINTLAYYDMELNTI
jgi:hypothetical protein